MENSFEILAVFQCVQWTISLNLPSLPFSQFLSSLANTWFKVTDYYPKPCCSNLPRLQILVGEKSFYLKKNLGEGGESLAKNEWEVTYFTRTANKNSAITQRGKAQSSCYHGWHLFLSWRALKASCATWKEELILLFLLMLFLGKCLWSLICNSIPRCLYWTQVNKVFFYFFNFLPKENT